jgi:hypothetical protein
MADADKNFFNKIIMEMRPVVLPVTLKKKQQSCEWVGQTSPSAKETEIPKVLH